MWFVLQARCHTLPTYFNQTVIYVRGYRTQWTHYPVALYYVVTSAELCTFCSTTCVVRMQYLNPNNLWAVCVIYDIRMETYTDPHKDVWDFGGSHLPSWYEVHATVSTLEGLYWIRYWVCVGWEVGGDRISKAGYNSSEPPANHTAIQVHQISFNLEILKTIWFTLLTHNLW